MLKKIALIGSLLLSASACQPISGDSDPAASTEGCFWNQNHVFDCSQQHTSTGSNGSSDNAMLYALGLGLYNWGQNMQHAYQPPVYQPPQSLYCHSYTSGYNTDTSCY
jgi:hypothetical protein